VSTQVSHPHKKKNRQIYRRTQNRKYKIKWNTCMLNGLSVEVTNTHPNFLLVHHAKTTCNETMTLIHAMPKPNSTCSLL
jgi:hypothetical protein